MGFGYFMAKCLILTAIFETSPAEEPVTPRVFSIEPHVGSYEGATRLYVNGQGFSSGGNFNSDPNSKVGNKAYLKSDRETVELDVDVDGSHETRLTLYTRPMRRNENYYIQVEVDGVPIEFETNCNNRPRSQSCSFVPRYWRTPYLRSCQVASTGDNLATQTSQAPGGLVTCSGRIFTAIFGSNNQTNENERTVSFRRVYVGGQTCELLREPDVFYNLELTRGDEGTFTCKPAGTFVGNQNISIILTDDFGRSDSADTIYRVSGKDVVYNFQTYAEITKVTPKIGSSEGGTELWIEGRNFDDTTEPVLIMVGGQPCDVVDGSLTREEVKCVTRKPGDAKEFYTGSRGITVEVWNETRSLPNEGLGLLRNASDYQQSEVVDAAGYHWPQEKDHFVAKFTGVFVAPKKDRYKFKIRSDDQSYLYMNCDGKKSNLTKVAWCPRPIWDYRYPEQTSDWITLQEGQQCYFASAVIEYGGTGHMWVGVVRATTTLTKAQAGDAKNEIQVVDFSATFLTEKQNINFTDWNSQEGQAEVQEITVTHSCINGGDCEYVGYRLTYQGVKTLFLTADAPAQVIRDSLKEIFALRDENIAVSDVSSQAGQKKYEVQFGAKRGDYPALGYEEYSPGAAVAGLSLSITEKTKGVAERRTTRLYLGGRITAPIPENPTAADVEEALEGTKSAYCPPRLLPDIRKDSVVTTIDYETAVGELWGSRVTDVEAFCGTTSVRSPDNIYVAGRTAVTKDEEHKVFDAVENKWMCLAHRGLMNKHLWLTGNFQGGSRNDVGHTHHFLQPLQTHETEWRYSCIDLMEVIHSRDGFSDVTEVDIQTIKFARQDIEHHYFIDAVTIGRDKVTEDIAGVLEMRTPPALASGEPISTVTVTKPDEGEQSFDIEVETHNCGHMIPLIELAYVSVASSSSDSATQRESDWDASTSFVSERLVSGVQPMTGYFDLTVKLTDDLSYNVTGIPVEISEEELEERLESEVHGFGQADVRRRGSCHARDFHIEWLSNGGDKPQMEVRMEDIEGHSDIRARVRTLQEGGIFHQAITGDMLRNAFDHPQVEVFINGLPSKCTGDCQHTTSEAQTPVVSGISPTNGSSHASTSITISGTNLVGNANFSSTVKIGATDCAITSHTDTQIVCTVGDGPLGTHDLMVNVGGKGYAKEQTENVSVAFTITGGVSSINPATGFATGGTEVIIAGHGFSDTTTFKFDGTPCTVIRRSPTSVVCNTPTGSAGSVSVVAEDGSESLGTLSYNYTAPDAIITSISPNTSTLIGGGNLTIAGTGLGTGADNVEVFLQDHECTVLEWSSVQIICELPQAPPALYPPRILLKGKGYADTVTHSIPAVAYVLEVNAMSPQTSSWQGGTVVTLTGQGFTDEDTTEVTFGHAKCNVKTISSTEIECVLDPLAEHHVITNDGQHPGIGEGYAWEPMNLEIHEGDWVTWKWDFDVAPGSQYGAVVFSTSTSSNDTYDEESFRSSTVKTQQGAFTYVYNEVGSYYFSSGKVDSLVWGNIVMRGSVIVLPAETSTAELSVKVAGYEADYSKTSRKKRATACSEEVTVVDGCTPSSIANDPNTFVIVASPCYTPTVTSISPNQGTAADTLTINGNGFGTATCASKVIVGAGYSDEYECDVVSSNTTTITCKPNPNPATAINVAHYVKVNVDSIGDSSTKVQLDASRRFTLLPSVTGLIPASGSLSGGTMVNITGFGFSTVSGALGVTVGGYNCIIQSTSYYWTQCLTPSSASEATQNVVVTINGQVAKCTGTCRFQYRSDLTPTVTSISPTTVSDANTEITFAGTTFESDGSKMHVMLGEHECPITSSEVTEVKCAIPALPAGSHPILINVDEKGVTKLQGVATSIQSSAVITSMSPVNGSQEGGLLVTFTGNGFATGDLHVSMGDGSCAIIESSVTNFQFQCMTPAAAGIKPVTVTGNGQTFVSSTAPLEFLFGSVLTPTLVSISLTEGEAGDEVMISGSLLDPNSMTIIVGQAECGNITGNDTMVKCTLGDHSGGTFEVSAKIDGLGLATSSLTFNYTFDIDSVTPARGSFGGGDFLTITGRGFDENTDVVVCESACEHGDEILGTSAGRTEIVCLLSKDSSTTFDTDKTCDITVTVDGQMTVGEDLYTFAADKTPTVTGVSPARGGTQGGTDIVITGTLFDTDHTRVSVSIGGVVCVVTNSTTTEIRCTTEARGKSLKAEVEVTISGKGAAVNNDVVFYYVDLWSSKWTWGGQDPPVAGDFVVVPAGQTLVLDVDTPVLKMLLIQGGIFTFDEKDVHLQAENILITDGGIFQIGTEDEPFMHMASITLHGHLRSRELPIYGTKCIGVRNGTLDLHGKHVPITWTQLQTSAAKSTNVLHLKHAVTWKPGDLIVISCTGDRHSQGQTETVTISTVSADGMTLTIEETLKYNHICVTNTFDGVTVSTCAEVGLLTRTIVVQGSKHMEWARDTIPACPAGFDTGEFATQTCFQGRFGDEEGSDQFGAQIMIHHRTPDLDLAHARLEYVELRYMGQAFRLGRYPIHFHLLGDVGFKSYVKGCSIHQSFNRAVTIHNTHHLLVERNVVFDVMGGTIFIEDGIEHGNVIQYNLVLFARQSTSLQNDDITPAAMWVTNPNNTIQHNHVACGTHFGFWYRIHEHPDGPSADPNICQRLHPVGTFFNNTAHSQGWFGLWIFQVYTPRGDGSCGSRTPTVVEFRSLSAWNCEKGTELVNVGSIKLLDFIMLHNSKAGIEIKKLVDREVKWGQAGTYNSLIAAHGSGLDEGSSTEVGIILPFTEGYEVFNTTFSNFDGAGTAAIGVTAIDGTCSVLCGGWEARFSGISYDSSPYKARFRWEHEVILRDMDGTLTGTNTPSIVTPYNPTISNDACPPIDGFNAGSIPGVICDGSVKFHRVSWNKVKPTSLEAKWVTLSNENGDSWIPFAKKRLTHKFGWMATLMNQGTYKWVFQDAEHLTNISYASGFYSFEENDCVIISHNLTQKPDKFFITGDEEVSAQDSMVTCDDNYHGDYFFDANSKTVYYIVSGRARETFSPSSSFDQRSATLNALHREVNFRVYRCFYEDCIKPPNPNDIPPARERPEDYVVWHSSDPAPWSFDGNEYIGTSNPDGSATIPPDNQDIRIEQGTWMVINQDFPKINKLWIDGVLEVEWSDANLQFTLSATHIIIMGRLIVGWEDAFFLGSMNIVLRGDINTPDIPVNGGVNLGAKTIGVLGGLDLHGRERELLTTHLQNTLNAGQNTITVVDSPSSWFVGEDIVIATTSMDPWETETFRITAVNNHTITLNDTARFDHIAETFTYNDGAGNQKTYDIRAEVSMLYRNIRIMAEATNDLYDYSFGARVLIAGVGETRGYGRIQNTAFYHTGQEGFIDNYDPRYSLAFLNTGVVDTVKPSFVRRNVFHHGFNTAIGVFGATGLEVDDNVIHHTVGPAIRVEGTEIKVRQNLVMLVRTRSVYQDRNELDIMLWKAAIEVNLAKSPTLSYNTVVGSERAGYRIDGHDCESLLTGDMTPWGLNTVRASLQGIWMNKDGHSPCTSISNFNIHTAFDYGVYYQGTSNLQISDVLVTDSTLGFMPIVYSPASVSHAFQNKFIAITDCTVIAVSKSGHCPTLDPSLDYVINSGLARPSRRDTKDRKAKTGILFPSFNSGHNKAPSKPFTGSKSYPAIGGRMEVKNVSFVNFGDQSCSTKHTAFMTNLKSEDFLHPIIAHALHFHNSPDETRLFYHRPSLGKINPSDCVDMECDGMKKALLIDKDGSMLGTPGAVIPEAEFEWDGDRQRGLGDYRIPKTLLTNLDGSRIPVNDIAPNKGIIRANTSDAGCISKPIWRAHQCHGYEYTILVIESLDADTETRRISPVALLADSYVDLNNGPQDHGWCAGYTCQERLSTFWTIVAYQRTYEMHFTGTAPEKLRLRMLNVDASAKMIMKIYYTRPQRKDVYVNNRLMKPTNSREVEGKDILQAPNAENPHEFKPTLSSPIGENYYDRDFSTVYVLLTGEAPVDIVEAAVLVINFNLPFVSPDEFFDNGQLITNLANFLDIPAIKIRIVKAVRERSTSGRRKREDAGAYVVTVEVGESPPDTLEVVTTDPGATMSPVVTAETTLSPADQAVVDVIEAAVNLANALQEGTLADHIHTAVSSLTLIDPRAPAVHDPNNTDIAGTIIDTEQEYFVPQQLRIIQQPASGNALSDFSPQIQVTGLDANGNDIVLGHPGDKWQATVLIQNGPDGAKLSGTTIAKFEEGVATFENLTATVGGSYVLKIMVSYPTSRQDLHAVTDPFTLEAPLQTTQPTTTARSIDTGADNLPYIIAGSVVGGLVLIALIVIFIMKGPCTAHKRGKHKISDSHIDMKNMDETYMQKKSPPSYSRSQFPPAYDGPESQHPHAVMDDRKPPAYDTPMNVYENPEFGNRK